nr:CsbD family protein [Flavobacterium sp. HJJ]
MKGKLKQKYADLTDDDLLYEEGKKTKCMGKSKKELVNQKMKLQNGLPICNKSVQFLIFRDY